MSFTFIQRRLLPSLYLKFTYRRLLPHFPATIQNTAGIVHCSTSSSTERTSNVIHVYYPSNVPLKRYDDPDLSEGIPIDEWKEGIVNKIEAELKNKDFGEAIDGWKYFVEKTQNIHGINKLIEFAFENNMDNMDELRKDIEKIWKISQINLHAGDFIAYLILTMIKMGEFEEAKYFTEKFIIHGTSFIEPIKLMELDLNFLEQFGQILEKIYLTKPKRKRKKKKKSLENAEEIEKNEIEIEEPKKNKFIKLIWIWEPPKQRSKKLQQKNKYDKMRVHKVDEIKLEKLINFFLPFWAKKIVEKKKNDLESLERLKNFVSRNKLQMAPQCEELCLLSLNPNIDDEFRIKE